jgi:hypothetical protein
MTYLIQDWTGKVCFLGEEFNSFDDAEEFLSKELGADYETDRQEYEITSDHDRSWNFYR